MNNQSFFTLIEEEKEILIGELDKIFIKVDISNIPTVSQDLEIFLKEYLHLLLIKYSIQLFNLKKNEQNIYLSMEKGNQLYSLNMESDVFKFNTLTIFLNPIGIHVRQQDLKKFTIKINSYGKIRLVKFLYLKNFPVQFDILNSLILNILEVGYGWFKSEIERLVTNEKLLLSQNLYDYLKRIIPSDELRKNLWFASITEGYGFRLIERNVALSLFEIIDENANIYGDSTNQFVAEMLSTKLPSNQLLMQKAIDNNAILDGDISDASYFKEGNIYAGAMSSLYGSNKFTIHPIFISEQVNVLLLYPTELRSILEPIIDSHKDTLSKKSKDSMNKLHQTLKSFDISNDVSSGKIGEFLGGFMKGMLDI